MRPASRNRNHQGNNSRRGGIMSHTPRPEEVMKNSTKLQQEEIEEILKAHILWLKNEGGGRADLSCANLSCADLRGANLRDADLSGAYLRYADLSGANLHGANLRDADLSGAYLRYADLSGANLHGANLHGANLHGANLHGANLHGANLRDADLSGAYLRYADLHGADLSGADLSGADLSGAYLRYANLRGANLNGADLSGANLHGADLSGAKNAELAFAVTVIVPEGELIGWKKCRNNVLVKLEIPADSRRSNASGRKCRCEFANVLEVIGADEGVSLYEKKITYRTGETVHCDQWDENRWNECSGGVHFFITREEAEAWEL